MLLKALTPPCHVVRHPPLNHEDDRDALSYLVLSDSWGGSKLHEYRHAYVSPYGVVFRDGAVESASLDYSLARFRGLRRSFIKKIVLGRTKRIDGTCVVCHNAFFKNYYHWLLEALPRLFSVRDEIRDARLILCSDVDEFHLQTLKLFELRDVVFVGRDELVLADKLLLPSPMYAGYGQHNPALLAEMSAWIREKVQSSRFKVQSSTFNVQEVPVHGRRLYVGRGADKRRKIVNEPELIVLLETHGFEAVRLEGYSFAEQVALFSHAEVVAGIHGAGLSNMIFMKPGGVVFEFVNERYRDGCFFNLAAACGHRNVVLPCRLAGPTNESGPKYYDMKVDLDKVRRYLELEETSDA